ncbi:transposase [Embleya sp. NBC_00896]|uniref:transposase n=1 Tax=Embleya sp. NBC_00896 TaxID=2975961 RepID=UPI0038698823
MYLPGLTTDGRRKSVEPMAARLGGDGSRTALANFVTTSSPVPTKASPQHGPAARSADGPPSSTTTSSAWAAATP